MSVFVISECGGAGLKDGGEIVPESWGQLRSWIRERWGDEGAVLVFCGIVFCPDWTCSLVVGVREIGDVGYHVENTVGDGILWSQVSFAIMTPAK